MFPGESFLDCVNCLICQYKLIASISINARSILGVSVLLQKGALLFSDCCMVCINCLIASPDISGDASSSLKLGGNQSSIDPSFFV
jgi:hypothetical protein